MSKEVSYEVKALKRKTEPERCETQEKMRSKKKKACNSLSVPHGLILQALSVTILLFHIRDAACTWGIFGINFHIFILQVVSIIKHSRRNLSTKKMNPDMFHMHWTGIWILNLQHITLPSSSQESRNKTPHCALS